MEAAKLFASQSDRCLVKLVKMRENPTFDELFKELIIINERYTYIFSQFKNLTIKLERQKNKQRWIIIAFSYTFIFFI